MRILVLGPRFADGFADNVAGTLVEMGHEVLGAEEVDHAAYWSVPRRALRMVEERVFGDAPLPQDRKLLRLAKDRRPDALLALTWDVHPEILDERIEILRRQWKWIIGLLAGLVAAVAQALLRH